jgi:hypothetical protein
MGGRGECTPIPAYQGGIAASRHGTESRRTGPDPPYQIIAPFRFLDSGSLASHKKPAIRNPDTP